MPSIRSRPPHRPLGITALAFLQVLTGIQMLVGGLWLVGISSGVVSAVVIVAVLGLAYIGFGVGSFVLARGYLVGLESTRRRGRTVAMLSILLGILLLFFVPGLTDRLGLSSPGWTIFHNIIIALYLGSSGVRRYFNPTSRS